MKRRSRSHHRCRSEGQNPFLNGRGGAGFWISGSGFLSRSSPCLIWIHRADRYRRGCADRYRPRAPAKWRARRHLYGRMQRYVSSVKSEISQRSSGRNPSCRQSFKNRSSRPRRASSSRPTVVDELPAYRGSNVNKVVAAMR